jgi:hypothetical protein
MRGGEVGFMKTNINESSKDVNKKIRPVFSSSLYSDLGYSTLDGSYKPSLEEQVTSFSGPTDNTQYYSKDDKTRFTVNRLPELVSSLIWNLKNKHERLSSQAAVERFLTRAGVLILERMPALKQLNTKRRAVLEDGTEQERLAFIERHYSFGYRISIKTLQKTIYSYEWISSAITEMSSDLGINQEVIVTASLIAGLSTSAKWVPSRHSDLMMDETMRFVEWVQGLVEEP